MTAVTLRETTGRPGRTNGWSNASSGMLDELLTKARGFGFEFLRTNADGTIDADICNHLDLALISSAELGASDAELRRFYDSYVPRWPLEPVAPIRRPITGADWHLHLGDRRYEPEYRQFFADEVRRLGPADAVRQYLPVFIEGPASSAYHAMIRVSYACLRGDATEVALGLAYWAATFLRFPRSETGRPFSSRPADALKRMRDDERFRKMPHKGIGLWSRMNMMGSEPAFSPVIDWLAVAPESLATLAADSLALYVNTNDMRALHAMTACQALRELLPYLSPEDEIVAIRYLWQAIASVYGLMGFLEPTPSNELDRLRDLSCPSWDEIKAAATKSLDEHDLKIAFVMSEEEKAYGEPLYRLASARRMKLAPGF